MATEQDSVWKEILDAYFQEFMAFFFPYIHAEIDWAKDYEFLDKELEKMQPDDEVGRKVVDKLVKVYELDGSIEWVLIHIEVQGYPEPNFEGRMNRYNYRILDRYNKEVVSLAILTDVNQNYRPGPYRRNKWGNKRYFEFPIIKVIDYNNQWAALETDPNPFALVVMAHLKSQQAKKPDEQLRWKLILVRMLYERGYERQQIVNLFRFIDWLIRLPAELEQDFRQELDKLQEEKAMPYVTSIERLAKAEGLQEGRIQERQGLVKRLLKRSIGELPPEVAQQISQLSFEQLGELGEALLDFKDEAALKNWLATQ